MCVFDQCSLFQHICILFSVNPDKDPLCVLLLIDYFAVRSCEYDFLINLYKSWEVSIVVICVSLLNLMSISQATQKSISAT